MTLCVRKDGQWWLLERAVAGSPWPELVRKYHTKRAATAAKRLVESGELTERESLIIIAEDARHLRARTRLSPEQADAAARENFVMFWGICRGFKVPEWWVAT